MKIKNTGFTILELMIAVLILAVALLALWTVYIKALDYAAWAKEITIATDDLRDVSENIKSVVFADITTVFPDGGAVPPSVIGGFLLNGETITVHYPRGTDADPLEIEVAISWVSKTKGIRTETFKTIRTGVL